MLHDDPPETAADVAADALKGLAHSTRRFAHPSETYWVIGPLLSGALALEQSLFQIATAHNHPDLALDERGDPSRGLELMRGAMADLRAAADALDKAYAHLNAASQKSGAIAWRPAPPDVGHEAAPRRRGSAPKVVELGAHRTLPAPETGLSL